MTEAQEINFWREKIKSIDILLKNPYANKKAFLKIKKETQQRIKNIIKLSKTKDRACFDNIFR